MKRTQNSTRIRDFELLNKQSPLGNFFQSREFYEALNLANQHPFLVTTSERELSGGLLAYTFDAPLFIPRIFPALMVYYGPVLAENAGPNTLGTLLRNLDSEARKRGAVRVDIRTPFPPPTLNDVFLQNGYTRFNPGGEYSVIIDLAKDENTLWSEMRRSTRRAIKKAIQRNVEIKEVANYQDLCSFYQIYLHLAQRRHFAPRSFSLLNALKSKLQPKGITKFFLAWHGEKPIAGILNVIYNGQSIPFLAASLKDYWNLFPNHLLFWHSIRWSKVKAKVQIFKLYHLPKAEDHKSGINYRPFKTSFGGDLIRECSFYYKNISPLKLQILEKTTRLFRAANFGQILRAVEVRNKLKT